MEPLFPTDPARIGRYRLSARLGTGGMGQVYLAHTPSGRNLVIKVIRPELASEDGFRSRFTREADAARRVGGFHTAQVVDSDPDADPPWIATAHVPGPTLEQAVREHGPITPPALHVLAAGLAEGLTAIHTCGLVHRDLKPANIILTDDGPRIIDFGIARPLDADSMTTQGAVFGTLPYMSPEQTDGSRVGPASDVFSLGTVLAFAATGTNPFNGATMAETVRRLISPPPDPGDLDPDTHKLITGCWNHDPTERPSLDQILALFEGHDLHDSWPPPPTRAKGASYVSSSDPRSETDRISAPPRTKVETAPPPPATDTDVSPRPTAEMAGSARKKPKHKRGRYISAATAVVLVLTLFLWHVSTSSRLTLRPDGYVGSVTFSPDGTILATDSDHNVQLWDTTTGANIATLTGHTDLVNSVAFSPDGTRLGTGSRDETARIWDVNTGETITTLTGHHSDVPDVAFSPDGTTLVTSARHGSPHLWDVETGEVTSVLDGHDSHVISVAFSPNGDQVATGSHDKTVRIWDVGTGETTSVLTGHDDNVYSVTFSPDGTTLASGSSDGTARIWDTTTGENLETFSKGMTVLNSVAFSPDGATLATGGGAKGNVWMWDIDSGENTTTLSRHSDSVRSVEFSPDGTTLATGSSDGTARLWDIG